MIPFLSPEIKRLKNIFPAPHIFLHFENRSLYFETRIKLIFRRVLRHCGQNQKIKKEHADDKCYGPVSECCNSGALMPGGGE
jgi:hypothetical protein